LEESDLENVNHKLYLKLVAILDSLKKELLFEKKTKRKPKFLTEG